MKFSKVRECVYDISVQRRQRDMIERIKHLSENVRWFDL